MVTSVFRESVLENNFQCNSTDEPAKEINIVLGAPCDYGAGRVTSLVNHWNWPLFFTGAR